jgi:hypothetical protein
MYFQKDTSMRQHTQIRLRFYQSLFTALRIVWPILSGLLGLIIGLGLLVGYFEAWPPFESVYFAFVTALTVGYGDVVPMHPVSRIMAIGIGFIGILLTALFAAISVHALGVAIKEQSAPPSA